MTVSNSWLMHQRAPVGEPAINPAPRAMIRANLEEVATRLGASIDAIVEISDLRFPQMRPDRPASFTYRVRFAQDGSVISQGWVKPKE